MVATVVNESLIVFSSRVHVSLRGVARSSGQGPSESALETGGELLK